VTHFSFQICSEFFHLLYKFLSSKKKTSSLFIHLFEIFVPLQKQTLKHLFCDYEEELLQMREQGVCSAAHFAGFYSPHHIGIMLWSHA